MRLQKRQRRLFRQNRLRLKRLRRRLRHPSQC
jgi:hypothetical protein